MAPVAKHSVWVLILLLIAPSLLRAQSSPMFAQEAWTTADGLPVNGVNSVVQSSDGYIWLATFDGLVRFDGVRFTVFNTSTTPALSSNRIVEIVETPDATLWLRTEHGELARMKNGDFYALDSEERVIDARALALYLDQDSVLWIGTEAGVMRYRNGVLDRIPRFSGPAFYLHRDCDGALWVGTREDGFFVIDADQVQQYTTEDGLPSNRVTAIEGGAACTIWIGTSEGLSYYAGGALATFSRVPEWVFSLHLGQDEQLWIAGAGGVYVLSDNDSLAVFETWEREWAPTPLLAYLSDGTRLLNSGRDVVSGDRPVFSVGDDQIRSMLVDREENIWLATGRSGLHRLRKAPFRTCSEPEGTAGRNVYPVVEDANGNIWFGTWDGGLNRLSPDGSIRTYSDRDGSIGPAVSALHVDREGALWVASNLGVCRFEGDTCVGLDLGEGRHWHDVRVISGDRNGSLWFGTAAGLFRYREPLLTHYTTDDGLPHDNVRAIRQAHDGTLWLGTNGGGLAALKNGRFTAISTDDGLPSNLIRAIYQDGDGVLWIGTEDRGLARIAEVPGPEDGALRFGIRSYSGSDGLFDEVIHQILEDDRGRLWMSSNRGIFWVERGELIDFAEGRIQEIQSFAYTERDGLRNREANGGSQPAGIRSGDGRLWFPTQDGLAVVDPNEIGGYAIPVLIERVRSGQGVLSSDPSGLRLPAAQRSFEIEYAGLSFREAERLRFQYRLAGFDADWMEAGSRRVAYYTNVPAGTYAFSVRANLNGTWSEVSAPLSITVAPYFIETPWFYGLCLVVLVLLGWAGLRWRVRRLKVREQELMRLVEKRTAEIAKHEAQLESQNARLALQAEKLQELDEAKSRLFANVSHEFRTPLTLILGPAKSALEGTYGPVPPDLETQLGLIERNAYRLLRLVNQILDLASVESGGFRIDPRPQDVVAFVRRTVQAFMPLAERCRITVTLRSAPESCRVPFDADAFEKALANILSNALKFTPQGGSVDVSITRHSSIVEVGVEDTGIGIPAEKLPHVFDRYYQVESAATRKWEGTGIGLALAKEIVEMHGGTISAESEHGKGSKFTVRLPLDAEPESTDAGPVSPHPSTRSAAPTITDQPLVTGDGSDLLGAAASTPPPDHDPGTETELPDADSDRTTVLIVDDNSEIRRYIRSILETDYRTIEASDGRHGLSLAAEVLPDLIIADVMMPEMDGFTLSRQLKLNAMTDCIPVILLTAKAASEDEIHGLETGADDYITKPFDEDVLKAKVRNLIALRRRLRERLSEAGPSVHEESRAASGLERRARLIIEEHLLDGRFSVEVLASEMAMSRSQLFRKLRDEAGVTPVQFIRTVRTERAAALLQDGAGSVSEVGYAVGFESLSHFTRCFRERFGVPPSEFLKASVG